ncbi:uncharacterized protein Z518_03776 [Rhinocladiella mackenziei CBS 650.93]|uniref:Rhinocladiella mackenziei CBS 650.93 unplaced genomic scaffold supercont1.3, whole genome shotgun sequence n=1 Tax=Rhinocladiella mackenziei CBS 650.93 TaxID=1442369 RepID=A0A0D2IJ93_9EURO|nr:uncharacterized protein Z518_03776 [Rhinocladiella mackenziei CBS 650.93]KIX05804.1 hypothetical protein Z518_03776 [Rhinocladiella mackenziei CBS 650.93]
MVGAVEVPASGIRAVDFEDKDPRALAPSRLLFRRLSEGFHRSPRVGEAVNTLDPGRLALLKEGLLEVVGLCKDKADLPGGNRTNDGQLLASFSTLGQHRRGLPIPPPP